MSIPQSECGHLAGRNPILWSDYLNGASSPAIILIGQQDAEEDEERVEEGKAEQEQDSTMTEGRQNLAAVAAEMKRVHGKAVHPNRQKMRQQHAAKCTCTKALRSDIDLEKAEQNWPHDIDTPDGVLRWETARNAQATADFMMEMHPELIPEAKRREPCVNEHCQILSRELLHPDAVGVPHVVIESLRKSGYPREALDEPKTVQEKEKVEWELLAIVPEARATSEGFSSTNHSAGATVNLAGSLMMAEDDQEYVYAG